MGLSAATIRRLRGVLGPSGAAELADLGAPAPVAAVAEGQDWRDETANRVHGNWYLLHPTRAVMIQYTFEALSSGEVDIIVRYGDPDHYQDAVTIAELVIPANSVGEQRTLTSIIPPGQQVQFYGTVGIGSALMLELTL